MRFRAACVSNQQRGEVPWACEGASISTTCDVSLFELDGTVQVLPRTIAERVSETAAVQLFLSGLRTSSSCCGGRYRSTCVNNRAEENEERVNFCNASEERSNQTLGVEKRAAK